LNPSLLAHIAKDEAFRVFICPLAQLPFDRASRLHASDVRLIRRIVRDRHSRGYNAADTINRWESVRAGERKHIFPFQHHADAVFDSSLIYEIAVLKVYAERYLLEVPRNDPAWLTAFRLLGLTSLSALDLRPSGRRLTPLDRHATYLSVMVEPRVL
jgi:uridine kinase